MNLQNFQTMDTHLLLSIINMKLRNNHCNLDDLTRYYDIDGTALRQKLATIGYQYHNETNQFTHG